MTGDIYQRIADHGRIEHFVTFEPFNVLFSLFNLVVFSIVLASYNVPVLLVFLAGSFCYMLWLLLFIGKRKEFDYKFFNIQAKGQNYIMELINGMNEVKLNNCGEMKRWEWEHLQAERYDVSVRRMSLNQLQYNGSTFINELKNIIITIMTATAVIDDRMTLGMMLAIQYIIGQLNGPLMQSIQFMYTVQDARISLERLNEVHEKKEEDAMGPYKCRELVPGASIHIKNLTFQYDGPKSPKVLDNISLDIPYGQVTAVVGASGSGKTTLFNLLSKSYDVDNDSIFIDDVDINKLSKDSIRDNISVITQSPYLFNLSIKDNLKLVGENVKDKDIVEACKIAQIHDFIQTLPHKYNTIIGEGGVNLSGGQRQRIAIARALIKKSKIILFDEATSALDNITQKEIQKSINNISADYTIIIVAHRLSTIKECSRIYVMDKGKIVGVGTHKELLEKNKYYKQLYNQELV